MAFHPDIYRTAAFERLNAAYSLLQKGNFVEANYLAGVSVECMLRAYHGLTGLLFDERHDLLQLAKSSGYLSAVQAHEERQVSDVLGAVVEQWRNNHRYRTLKQLQKFLKDKKLDRENGRDIKGGFVKRRCYLLLMNASWLVHLGDKRWNL